MGCQAEAKVFNSNTEKLDPKTVGCHFIGYPEKSKGYRFYCPDRHTKFIETRHADFLEDQMIRGSMVARKIDLEEKRVFVPTLMTQEPYFSLPVVAAPIEQETAVPTPVVSPPDVAVQETVVPPPVVGPPNVAANRNEGPVPQDQRESVAMDEGEQQQPPM